MYFVNLTIHWKNLLLKLTSHATSFCPSKSTSVYFFTELHERRDHVVIHVMGLFYELLYVMFQNIMQPQKLIHVP